MACDSCNFGDSNTLAPSMALADSLVSLLWIIGAVIHDKLLVILQLIF